MTKWMNWAETYCTSDGKGLGHGVIPCRRNTGLLTPSLLTFGAWVATELRMHSSSHAVLLSWALNDAPNIFLAPKPPPFSWDNSLNYKWVKWHTLGNKRFLIYQHLKTRFSHQQPEQMSLACCDGRRVFLDGSPHSIPAQA